MSLWSQSQQLPPDALRQVRNIYSEHQFPIEVRHYMAVWIEDKMQHWLVVLLDNNSSSVLFYKFVT